MRHEMLCQQVELLAWACRDRAQGDVGGASLDERSQELEAAIG